MGKAASKVTRAFGFGGKKRKGDEDDGPSGPKPPQWDTSIDELFGDAPPDDNIDGPAPILDAPMRPKRRRRPPPPPPPSIFNRGRRASGPASPLGRRRHPRGKVHAMRTPIVPDMPRRIASRGGGVHAVNGPFGVNRRPMVLPVPVRERDLPSRVSVATNFKRRSSGRRRR